MYKKDLSQIVNPKYFDLILDGTVEQPFAESVERIKVPELMLNDKNFSYFVFEDLMVTLDITKFCIQSEEGHKLPTATNPLLIIHFF